METISSTDGYREYQVEAHRIISEVIENALKTYGNLKPAEQHVQEEKTAAEAQEENLEKSFESTDGILNIRWPPSRDFVMETGLTAIEKFIEVITLII
jgi:hypothetical protein